tara:strand:- start:3533 stop:4663 length:1131 start_codon:yes stop_codon:yes gene_type:complete
MSISFNRPTVCGNELVYLKNAIESGTLSGGGEYSNKCEVWFSEYLNCASSLLTPSCTHALEMSAILFDIKDGDEVIMPSYTFASTANAFALRGAKIVFVDIRPDTMNIDEKLIENAITDKTKVIVPVHYAGVSCEMDTICAIAKRNNVLIVEDAAQAIGSKYKGVNVGSKGHLSAFSFHATKNITSGGEGGLLAINHNEFSERAQIIQEKGTDRKKFIKGLVDRYTWIDLGSSYLPSELQAAYLYAQLLSFNELQKSRLDVWNFYNESLQSLEDVGKVILPSIPSECVHNAHMYFIKVENSTVRDKLTIRLKRDGICLASHYLPLHSSKFGKEVGRFSGKDTFTTIESERLIRLPLWTKMNFSDANSCCDSLKKAL